MLSRNFRNKIIIVFSILLAILLLAIFGRQIDDETKTNNIQLSVSSAEKVIDKQLSHFTSNNINDKEYLQNLIDEKNFLLFFYKQDSITFWSSSTIAPETNQVVDTFGFIFLSNGWYLYKTKSYDDFKVFCAVIIKNEHPFQNEYLSNTFIGEKSNDIKGNISLNKGNNNINNSKGKFLFSIDYFETSAYKDGIEKAISLLFVLFIMFFGWLLYLFHAYRFKHLSKHLSLTIFIVVFVSIRAILQIFSLPSFIYKFDIFLPYSYGLSQVFPSLGDLYVNIAAILLIAGAIFKHYRKYQFNFKSNRSRNITFFILLIIPLLWYFFSYLIIQSLVIDSNIELTLNDIFSFEFNTLMAVLIICSLWSVFILFTHRLSSIIIRQNFEHLRIIYFIVITIVAILINQLLGYSYLALVLFIVVFPTIFIMNRVYKKFSVTPWLIYILIFSAISTLILQISNQKKEKEVRILHAQSLSIEQDPVIEYLFNESRTDFYQDNIIPQVYSLDTLTEEELVNFMLGRYFNNNYYRDNYHIQVTFCNQFHDLEIEDDNTRERTILNCFDFFEGMIENYGRFTSSKDFYYIEENTPQESYLGVLEIVPGSNEAYRIYIEFISKYIPDQLGYPRLLSNEEEKRLKYLPKYAYAIYDEGSLVSNYGQTIYPIALSEYKLIDDSDYQFFNSNFNNGKYNHLIYKIDSRRYLIISKKLPDLLAQLAPLSYLILFMSLFFVLGYMLFYFTPKTFTKFLYYKNRLQIIIGVIIFVSFLIIGVSSLLYIKKLNNDKNFNILSEKTHSVLVEVEHKLSSVEELSPDFTGYVTGILNKFSNVFFTDINLFDLEGNLLASSYTQIFKEEIISTKMNPIAYQSIARDKGALFIHRENIGELEFLSAYIPFRNVNNHVVAYLNLPYFAKENQLKTELSNFMQTYVNIYFLLAALSIFVGLIISNYLIRPLKLVEESMTKIQLGSENKKIDWPYPDEIGNLITEYNKMIDVLEESAVLLAKSEREGAWREMAKQVAHEIKNPLTPMKLSVQYLLRTYKEADDRWGDHLKRFSNTIIEQIDTLAEIATEFSDFARTPITKFNKVSLIEAIRNSVHLFSGSDNIAIQFHYDESKEYSVLGDNNQLLRVFNNLIKNSKQAIEREDGMIDIHLSTNGSVHEITIKDNGKGIPEDQKDKIFNPSFTTKTSGAGLGLAIVKSIVESAKGQISFVSEQGLGTIFNISIPVYESEPNTLK